MQLISGFSFIVINRNAFIAQNFTLLIFRKETTMLKSDVNTFIGDFGIYQLRIFFVLFFMDMLMMDSIQIVFIGANMAHWCRVPELDDLPYDVQKNVAIPALQSTAAVQDRDGSIEYSSCEMFSLNYSVYNRSQFYSWNRSLMVTNHTSLVHCSQWTYDQSQFRSTIVSKVRSNQFWRYQLYVRQLQRLLKFVRIWHRGGSLLSTISYSLLLFCLVSLCLVFNTKP